MFHLRFQWRRLPLHIIGGAAMGFGAALIPGGNAVLVLNAFPALSPHAAPAYFSIILGAAMALFTSQFLRRAAHFSTPARIMSGATPNRHLSPLACLTRALLHPALAKSNRTTLVHLGCKL